MTPDEEEWVSTSDRMPTEEERTNCIEWYSPEEDRIYMGHYVQFGEDTWVRVEGSISMLYLSVQNFTYWRVVTYP